MLDPSLCRSHDLTGHWTLFNWRLLNGLTNPSLVLPPIFTLILLPWLIRPLRKRRRQISGLGVLLLLVYLIGCSPIPVAVGNQALVRFLPPDSGAAVDAIVVLGRGSDLRKERVNAAANLWQAGRSPLIFASGWGDAEPIVQLLETKGIPPQAVDGEPCSRTTEENARFTAEILQPQGIRKILLVTDPPHMLRSLLTFRSLGFEVIPHLNPLPSWLNRKKEAFLVFREYAGLVSYGLLGRFSPRSIPAEAPAQAIEPKPQGNSDALS